MTLRNGMEASKAVVDKYLGTSFDTIKEVHGSLADIQLAADAIQDGTISDTLVLIKKEVQLGSQAPLKVFTLTTLTYLVGTNNLSVYKNGIRLEVGQDYTESSPTTVTVTALPSANDRYVFMTNERTDTAQSAAPTTSVLYERIVATAGQTAVTLASEYVTGSNGITVFRNGILQTSGNEYAETNNTTITFTNALNVGDNIDTYIGLILSPASESTDVSTVSTLIALKALTGLQDNESVNVLGHTTVGDGGGGIFRYDASDATADDNGIHIAPTVGSGRWIRQYSGAVNIKWFGAVGDGATANQDVPIQAAIDYVAAQSSTGGEVCVPNGVYLINATILIPDNVHLVGEGLLNTNLSANVNNLKIVKLTGSNGGIRNVMLTHNSKTGIHGLTLAANDETDQVTVTNTNSNIIANIRCNYLDEGIVLRPGPDVGGTDSGCWYNKFSNVEIVGCTRGIWFRTSWDDTTDGSGANRNYFYHTKIGVAPCNTGIQIDAGDTNIFFGLTLEGINNGTSPNTSPTAIVVKDNAAPGAYNNNNMFFGVQLESCTVHMENDNATTMLFGGQEANFTNTGTKNLALQQTSDLFNFLGGPLTAAGLRAKGSNNWVEMIGDAATKGAIIGGTSGTSATYNGLILVSNELIGGAQANTSLPTWRADIGGIDNATYPGSGDAFSLFRKPAAGAYSRMFGLDNTGNMTIGGAYNIVHGTGSPEGVVTANPGSLYINTSGGAGTTLYVKEAGGGNTGWVGK